jgi:hypothetical protein
VEGACGRADNQVIWDWRTGSVVFVCSGGERYARRVWRLWNGNCGAGERKNCWSE